MFDCGPVEILPPGLGLLDEVAEAIVLELKLLAVEPFPVADTLALQVTNEELSVSQKKM
jgi:hypothetical protein